MEEARPGGEDGPEEDPLASVPAGSWPAVGVGPPTPAPDPLEAEATEVRRMVEAGASSPEELRALAARLRELREREEARWRSEVKPALLKEKKGKAAADPSPSSLPSPSPSPLPLPSPEAGPVAPPGTSLPPSPPVVPAQSRPLWIGTGLLVMVGLALVAVNTTVWVLILPAVALLVWAWVQGQRGDEA